MVTTYVAIFVGYILPWALGWNQTVAFIILYLVTILVCCPMWILVQFRVMRRSHNWNGLSTCPPGRELAAALPHQTHLCVCVHACWGGVGIVYIVAAGVTGLFGLLAAMVPQVSNWLCDHINNYFNGQFWWYVSPPPSRVCALLVSPGAEHRG